MTSMPDETSLPTDASPPARATPALLGGFEAPASAKAVLLALLQLKGGAVHMTLPDRRVLIFGDGAPVDFLIKDYRFARRVLTSGDIGLAEGFMAGEWESNDLAALLTLLAANIERFTRLMEG